jgi:lipid A disaccharide synthetase
MKLICTRFNFATTVGIISGHPRYDNQTARIIDAIRSQSKEPIEFVGVIGDQYKDKLK